MKVNTTICDKCLSVLDGEDREDYLTVNDDKNQFHISCLAKLNAIEFINICNITTYYEGQYGKIQVLDRFKDVMTRSN